MLPEYGHSSAASASEQLYELIDGHAGVGDDAAEGARSDLLVVGYDNSNWVRFVMGSVMRFGMERYFARLLPIDCDLSLRAISF